MKILTNSQDKAVGGIVRMMNTFVESVLEVDPSVSFHFAIVSSDKNTKAPKRRKYTKTHYGFPADCMILPRDYYPDALNCSSSLTDLKNKLADLIDFYLESIEKSKPDVILINGTYYRPWALLQAARLKKIPHVVYVHGSIVQESRGLSDSSFCLSRGKEMERDFYTEDTHYIFPSVAALKGVLFSDLIQPDRLYIIHNSLDKVFFSLKSQRNNNPHVVGFALRWKEIKNTDFILNFIRFNKTTTAPYHIKVLSDLNGEESMPYQDEYTNFLPPKTIGRMVEFYQETDVIINPSFFETFGYVPAEAVASGTPALISANQGISEVFLKCGLERLISDFSNVSAIHEKIHSILQEGVSREEIEHLRAELDPVRLSKKILSVLSEAVK